MYSSYLALIRDMDLKGFLSRYSLKKLLFTSIYLTDFYIEFFKHNKIKEIFLFNARQSQARPLLRIANNNKIKVNVLEHTTVFDNSKGVRNFENNLPQNVSFITNKVKSISNSLVNKNKKNIYNYFKYKKMGLPVDTPVNKSHVLDQINQSVINYFKKENIEILELSYFDIASDLDIGKVDENYLFDVLAKLDLSYSDALFVSCTALPVLSIIKNLEKKIGKLVLSSNQTLIWDTLKQVNFKNEIVGYGELFNN